ncbi:MULTISPECIES: FkbM family methyltransferase [Amycolatopsis]|uniref:FkbM family methyltransferase n=1 Tax=Amycolatopsis albidoflavus TaxID=102226 RepID=A0ABW5HQD2_9PSEU
MTLAAEFLARIDGINAHESDYLYEEVFLRRAYLPPGMTLPPGAIVFDVGANIGIYTLFVLSECPTASVYAFEPVTPIVAKLRRNTAGFGPRVSVLDYGLSDVDREVDFTYYPGYSTMSGQRSYADPAADKDLVRERITMDLDPGVLGELLDYRFREHTCRCRVRPLSSVIDECAVPRVDMLKIDVQRAEADVLRGIADRHWPLIGQIVMEVHDESGTRTGGVLSGIVELLRGHGFRVQALQESALAGTDRYLVCSVAGHWPR